MLRIEAWAMAYAFGLSLGTPEAQRFESFDHSEATSTPPSRQTAERSAASSRSIIPEPLPRPLSASTVTAL
jgi:hypothetical protein